MIPVSDTELLMGFLALPLPLLISAPLCWYLVRVGTQRFAGNARWVAARIRLVANVLFTIGIAVLIGGLISANVFVTLIVDTGQEVGFSFAIVGASLLLCLLGVLFRNCSNTVRRLVDDGDDDIQIAVDQQLGTIAFIGWAGALFALFLVLLAIPLLTVMFLLFLLIAIPLAGQTLCSRRQCQLLWILTVAIRSKRNLSAELRNHASTVYGNHAASIRRLAHDLDAGLPLGESLLDVREKVYRGAPRFWRLFVKYNPVSLLKRFIFGPDLILPAWVIATIQTAEKTGTLEKSLAVASKQYLDSIRTRFTRSTITGLLAYLLAYASLAGLVVTFLMYFIMPKFKYIFDSFGTEFPAVTERLVASADFVAVYWYVIALLAIYPLRLLVRLGIGEPLAWKNLNSKLGAKLFPRLDAPDVLRQLSAVIRSGRPLTAALDALATTHQRDSARTCLAGVRSEVEAGGDCWEMLAKSGYLRGHDLQLIRVATNAGNLPWALDELAASRERTLEHRLQMAVSFVEPAMILAFGLLCLCIIAGFFMPLVKLINDLS